MPKLPRVTAKIFAGNAAEDDLGQFGSALNGTKITNNDISVLQALPAYEEGWRKAVISNRNYPTLQEMNSVQRIASQQIAYTLQNGMPEWDENTTYYTNQFCRVGKDFYCSKIDDNTGNNPVLATDQWELWSDFNNKADTDLSNLTEAGEKHFLNYNQLTNCILEAPNGSLNVTLNPDTITIPSGVKFLVANGRNANKTLKNIQYTVSEDVVKNSNVTVETNYLRTVVYNIATGIIDTIRNVNILTGKDSNKPAILNSAMAYLYIAEDTNLTYLSQSNTTTAEWQVVQLGFAGTCIKTSDTSVTVFPFQPPSLAKEDDIDGKWVSTSATIASNVSLPLPLSGLTENYLYYDLSNLLPNDGERYECTLYVSLQPAFVSGASVNLRISSNSNNVGVGASGIAYPSPGNTVSNFRWTTQMAVIEADRKLKVTFASNNADNKISRIFLWGYRKVR